MTPIFRAEVDRELPGRLARLREVLDGGHAADAHVDLQEVVPRDHARSIRRAAPAISRRARARPRKPAALGRVVVGGISGTIPGDPANRGWQGISDDQRFSADRMRAVDSAPVRHPDPSRAARHQHYGAPNRVWRPPSADPRRPDARPFILKTLLRAESYGVGPPGGASASAGGASPSVGGSSRSAVLPAFAGRGCRRRRGRRRRGRAGFAGGPVAVVSGVGRRRRQPRDVDDGLSRRRGRRLGGRRDRRLRGRRGRRLRRRRCRDRGGHPGDRDGGPCALPWA